jgi:hypothetical protein
MSMGIGQSAENEPQCSFSFLAVDLSDDLFHIVNDQLTSLNKSIVATRRTDPPLDRDED